MAEKRDPKDILILFDTKRGKYYKVNRKTRCRLACPLCGEVHKLTYSSGIIDGNIGSGAYLVTCHKCGSKIAEELMTEQIIPEEDLYYLAEDSIKTILKQYEILKDLAGGDWTHARAWLCQYNKNKDGESHE